MDDKIKKLALKKAEKLYGESAVECYHSGWLIEEIAEAIEKLMIENAKLNEKYHELLFAVASKFPDESRHETALRYILSAEHGNNHQVQEQENG